MSYLCKEYEILRKAINSDVPQGIDVEYVSPKDDYEAERVGDTKRWYIFQVLSFLKKKRK